MVFHARTRLEEVEMNELSTVPSQPSPLAILEKAITGGITSDNVAVVKELMAMAREQRAEDAKAQFVRAFFALQKEMPVIYADKEVRTKSGALAFEYVSPAEIQDTLRPLLLRHGFALMTGQAKDEKGWVTATVTLYHEAGHSEPRSFTVRPKQPNQLMDEGQCDAAATTSAERHALIKMFNLRTRIRPEDDARNVGEHVTTEQANELHARVEELGDKVDRAAFLAFAGASTFDKIPATMFSKLDVLLKKKEGRA
jgi:hypothetical protein